MMQIIYFILAVAFFVTFAVYKKRKLHDVKADTPKGVLFAYVVPSLLMLGMIWSVASFSVRGALLRDPLMLNELSVRYGRAQEAQQEREQRRALRTLTAEDFDGMPVLGNPEGNIIVAEFYCYTCPFCARSHVATTAMLNSDPDVKVVLVNFVINPQIGTIPARATMAAARQDNPEGLRALHSSLFAARLVPEGANEGNINELQTDLVLGLAREAGLNVERLRVDMFDPAIDRQLMRNRNLAMRLGVTGTPAYTIGNNEIIPGVVPAYRLLESIDEARRARRTLVRR